MRDDDGAELHWLVLCHLSAPPAPPALRQGRPAPARWRSAMATLGEWMVRTAAVECCP